MQALMLLKQHLHFRSVLLSRLLHLICRKRFIRKLSIGQKTNLCMPTNQGIQSKRTACRTTLENHINKSTRSSKLASLICSKCLPSPLSSARRTTNTYLNSGTNVRVQKTKERAPKISSLVSECSISSANVLV